MHKIKKPQKKEVAATPAPRKPSGVTTAIQPIIWPQPQAGKRTVLNIIHVSPNLPPQFKREEWQEITLSPQPGAQIQTDIRGLSALPAESCDAIWNAGSLPHLFAHEVPDVLKELYRILKPGGSLFMTLNDLQRATQSVTQGKLERELYRSPAGPITAIDLIYGHRASIAKGRQDLQIRTGFTASSIAYKLTPHGFGEVEVKRDKGFLLHVMARKVRANPPDKPLVRVIEEDINEMMRIRDNIDKAPELLRITPENGI